MTIPSATTPPITPPTIAPVGVEEADELETATGLISCLSFQLYQRRVKANSSTFTHVKASSEKIAPCAALLRPEFALESAAPDAGLCTTAYGV